MHRVRAELFLSGADRCLSRVPHGLQGNHTCPPACQKRLAVRVACVPRHPVAMREASPWQQGTTGEDVNSPVGVARPSSGGIAQGAHANATTTQLKPSQNSDAVYHYEVKYVLEIEC